jgi:hypothetical protein
MKWLIKGLLSISLLLTLSVTSFKAYSQTEWAPIGAKWSNEYDSWEWDPPHKTFWTFTSVKDTLVNNKQCRKIIRNSNSFFLMYSENEKVYYSVNDTFWLLYDFSLKAGDTLIIPKLNRYYGEFNSTIKTKYIIDTVDSIKISGKMLKRQNLHFIEDSDNERDSHKYIDGYIIEKIGCISYMFGYQKIMFDEWPDHLKCYQDSDIFYRVRSDFNCNGLDGISEIEKQNELQLYPNPVNDELVLNYSGTKPFNIEIVNSLGIKIMEQNNQPTDPCNINTQNYPKGIYYLILFNDKTRLCKKFVKL